MSGASRSGASRFCYPFPFSLFFLYRGWLESGMDFGDILDQWDRGTGRGGRAGPREKTRSGKTDKTPPEPPQAKAGRETPRSRKKAAPSGAAPGNAALIRWLSEHEVPDKDREAGQQSRSGGSGPDWRGVEAAEQRRRLREKKARAVLDLHGLTRGEAWTRLETFFEAARRDNCQKVLIVHGKGNHSPGDAVLKDLVRTFIERCPWAGESGRADKSEGASGATWVLLKGEPLEGEPLKRGTSAKKAPVRRNLSRTDPAPGRR